MPFSSNFTRVTFGADPAGGQALFVAGRTDASDPPDAIHVLLPHGAEPLTATVVAPGLDDWEVRFPDGNPRFKVGDDVFVVGVATRAQPHDPFVWEASFRLAAREQP
jgi:hypothetical protein